MLRTKKPSRILIALAFIALLLSSCGQEKRGESETHQDKLVSILVPVTISAIQSFQSAAEAVLDSAGLQVRIFSAEGDPNRFETIIESSLLGEPAAIIIFGTQLTNTALGLRFREDLPIVIASGISNPDLVDGLVNIGVNPPRTAEVAVISDSPRRDIYVQSAEVVQAMLANRGNKVGILYNESEINSKETAGQLRDALLKSDLLVEMGNVSSSENVLGVTKSLLLKGCQVVVIPHDKYVLPLASAVAKLCIESDPLQPVPVFTLDDGAVRTGGCAASVSVSYSDLGDLSALTALRALNGMRASSIPVLAQDEATIYLNYDVLRRAKLELPVEITSRAKDAGRIDE